MKSVLLNQFNKINQKIKRITDKWSDYSEKDQAKIEYLINDMKSEVIKKIIKQIKKKYHDFNKFSYELIKIKHDDSLSNQDKFHFLNLLIAECRESKQDKIITHCHVLIDTLLNDENIAPIDKIKKELEIDPLYEEGWKAYGSLLLNNHDYEGALRAFKERLELNKKSFESWFDIGKLYFKLERYSDAISNFRKSLEIDTNNSQVMDYLEQALKMSERL